MLYDEDSDMLSWAGPLLVSAITIIFVNLVLSGDNAVVIALAVKTLPTGLRVRAIIAGAACAVLLRVVATFFAYELLHVEFLKLAAGGTILWIAIKLFGEAAPSEKAASAASFWHAIWFIMVADVTMSLDNILAIAEVAHGNIGLLVFGLGISIPFVLFASGLLANLMDRYPIIVYLGAALLGQIGVEMMLTDQFVVRVWSPGSVLRYSLEAAGAGGVLVAGKLLARRAARAPESARVS